MNVLIRAIRCLLAFLMLVLGVLTVSYMQKRFDDSDLKKAVAVVQAKAPGFTGCRAAVTSRSRGRVSVVCDQGRWLVDVTQGLIDEEKP